MIDEYPNCKRLMEAYRRVYHMPNKTPLSILFEYASRLNLQVTPRATSTSVSMLSKWLIIILSGTQGMGF